MRALNRFVDAKRDNLIALAKAANEDAQCHPENEAHQLLANAYSDAADMARRISDIYRYDRANLVLGR